MDIATVQIADGEETHVVLGAPSERAVRVVGRIEQGSQPYAGAAITFMPAGGSSFDALAFGMTDADGDYAVEVCAPGLYDVSLARYPRRSGDENNVNFIREIPAVARVEPALLIEKAALSPVLARNLLPAHINQAGLAGGERRPVFGIANTDLDRRQRLADRNDAPPNCLVIARNRVTMILWA